MDHKHPILHDLLQLDQEPFHLKTYISDKRSHLNTPSPAAAPAISLGGGFLHVSSSTAAVLTEAAARIQNQQHSKPRMQIKNAGLSLFFGSFLKLLKLRRPVRNRDSKERENSEEIRISCSRSRLCSSDLEQRLPIRPTRFSLHKFSGRCRSPDSCSPATSPIRRAKQDREHCGNSAEEEKERCSPVSVLDTFFQDDEHESLVGEEDDHNLERSYQNIQRARKQLLERLERFEKLAALDQLDLEQTLLEASEESGQLPLGRKQGCDSDTSSSLIHSPKKMFTGTAYIRRLLGEDQAKIVMADLAREAAINTVAEWRGWSAEETAAEVEVAIFGGLIEECFHWIQNDSAMQQ